ncbi:MAG: hypothetical protein WKF84_11720 [Pyrinomonadaceae bacterium]
MAVGVAQDRSESPTLNERERRMQLSRTIKGKYAHLGVSSTDFAARKAAEITLEDRRFRR